MGRKTSIDEMSFVVYLRVGTVFQTVAYFVFGIPRVHPGLLSLRSVLSSRQTLTIILSDTLRFAVLKWRDRA